MAKKSSIIGMTSGEKKAMRARASVNPKAVLNVFFERDRFSHALVLTRYVLRNPATGVES